MLHFVRLSEFQGVAWTFNAQTTCFLERLEFEIKLDAKENELFSCQEIMIAGEFALQQQR
jgi:hypothetical protein